MSENYKPVKGDRVRVVLEGEVGVAGIARFGVGVANYVFPDHEEVVSVEKIEPPVEVFKPGDRIRRRRPFGFEITLGDDGFLQHFSTGEVGFYKYDGLPDRFDSSKYELVYRP